MYPGNNNTTLALPSTVHDKVIAGTAHHAPGISDASWIHVALRKPVSFALKRAFDIAVSGVSLAFLMPLLLLIAAAIKVEDRGPIFFSQLRWGRGGKLIRVYKFRSMRTEMCDVSGVEQTTENDPRVTRVGAFLRKANLDELPQLINILKGDMSIIGPRCHVPGMLAAGRLYEDLVEEYQLRHLVRPGLTGLAQVNGLRGPTDREDLARSRIAHDLAYIRNFSILLDMRIFARTVVKEIRGGTGF